MSKITQTNRTILFDEINPNKLDILTLIGDVEGFDSLSDDKVEEINKELLVENFDEFLQKFNPCVYSYFDTKMNKLCYSLEKNNNIPDQLITCIKLSKENSFFKTILSLIDARNINKEKISNFKYEDILELLSPKKVIEDLKQLRKEISYLFDKYENLDNTNPEKKEIGDSLNYKFVEASKNYNNVLSMLPLAMEDIDVRLSIGTFGNNKNQIDKIKPGLISIGSSGELEVVEYSSNTSLLEIESTKENSNKLAKIFIDDYKENTENSNEYVSNLIARSFVPLNNNLIDINIEEEINKYDSYLDLYKSSQEEFIKVSKELIKKILGVKLFFDQYEVKIPNMKPKLLITNINPELLLNPINKEKLQVYLNTVNNKNDFSNTIWFGILPNVNFDTNLENIKIKKIFVSSDNEDLKNKNKFSLVSNIANILEKYKIQLFFNFEANDKTDFKTFSIKGLEEYKNKTTEIENKSYSEYLILSIPNFTIIPKNKSKVLVGNKKINNEESFFYIDGIYVDSSYISAGITAAYQCPGYLKERFKNVDMLNPGIRINIESSENNFKIKSSMPKEISGYTNTIKNSINFENYGFIFSSENAFYDKENINNITVYKARSLNRVDGFSYEPIYKTLTSTYIERVLRYETTDFKEDRLNEFFSSSPNSTKSMWIKNSNNVNSILRQEDDMTHNIDYTTNSCSLNLNFAGDVKHLKLLINSKE